MEVNILEGSRQQRKESVMTNEEIYTKPGIIHNREICYFGSDGTPILKENLQEVRFSLCIFFHSQKLYSIINS